jgi:transcriptional regulator PpsR
MSGVTIAQPDLTLLLDLQGVIRQATLSTAVAEDGVAGWVGVPWTDTVGAFAGDKVRRMVEDARRSGVSAFRQINQRFPSGRELPMEFTTVRLGGKDGLIAIGRNLQAVSELQSRLIAAQQAREQDYWKLREVETRYRLLFDATQEAVLLLTVDRLRVVEANPAAIRALGFAPGWEFLPEVAAQDQEPLRAMLARVREHGRTPGIMLHLGPNGTPFVVRASLMATEAGQVFLLQLVAAAASPSVPARADPLSVEALIERLPDAFVVTDPDGLIRRANGGFLDLAQVGAESAVIGESLGRWLGMPGADLAALLASVQRHRVVRLFASRIQGEHGTATDVEVSAAADADGRPRAIAVLIRDVGRRVPASVDQGQLGAALNAIAGQVGQTPLLQLVRETTAAVERHYIEAALGLAAGNRTAAAELLGLSRQSLYVKLNRYGLDGAPTPIAEASD